MLRLSHNIMVRRVLLASGIAAVGVYGIGDLVSGMLSNGYSFRDQAISELSAFGSDVRPVMATIITVHGLLVATFGLGVWLSTDRRSLRAAGALLIAIGLVGLPTHTVFAMSSRGLESGFNDTMHIALTMVFSLLVFGAVVLAAVAYRGWFRYVSIATLLVLAGFGAAASVAMGGIDENSTPWVGAFERINAYAYFAWLVVLAAMLMRGSFGVRPGTVDRATRRELTDARV